FHDTIAVVDGSTRSSVRSPVAAVKFSMALERPLPGVPVAREILRGAVVLEVAVVRGVRDLPVEEHRRHERVNARLLARIERLARGLTERSRGGVARLGGG